MVEQAYKKTQSITIPRDLCSNKLKSYSRLSTVAIPDASRAHRIARQIPVAIVVCTVHQSRCNQYDDNAVEMGKWLVERTQNAFGLFNAVMELVQSFLHKLQLKLVTSYNLGDAPGNV